MVRTWETVMAKAKRAARSELKTPESWESLCYSEKDEVCNRSTDIVLRVDGKDMSQERFIREFEGPGRPVIIDSLTKDWPAQKEWTFENLRKNFGECKLKCGEDDDGKAVRVKTKYFLDYLPKNKDDSPLYIFDGTFGDDKKARKLLDAYRPPIYFRKTIFEMCGKRRPPYRWFLIGPKRSGTTLHTDPLGTSAWNSVITGRKRWVVFSPETPEEIAKGSKYIKNDDDDEAISYFNEILPKIRLDNERRKDMELYEFIQYPGETVYIPGGWWHAVLNLEDSVAITENYVNEQNFDAVWKETRSGRKKMARQLLKKFEECRPDLAARAKTLNLQDNFDMKMNLLDKNSVEYKEKKEKERLKKERKRAKKERKRAKKMERKEAKKKRKLQ
eukprot:g3649.t1